LDNRLPVQDKIKTQINRLLTERHIRLQPHRLIKKIQKALPDQSRTQIRATIKAMMAEGVLVYTNVFSSTYIVQNQKIGLQVTTALQQNSKVPCSKRDPQTMPIQLLDGLSFGDGEHPTTQLCLKGIEALMPGVRKVNPGRGPWVLDIGTGSGVLAIAAALLGAEKVIAMDIDPRACREARINVELNQVSETVSILGGDLSVLKGCRFDLVLANLRGPTLQGLLGQISERINNSGVGLFSGFRRDESNFIATVFRSPQWEKIWDSHGRGWAAVAIERQDGR
jgi:ribosomal protein L11 methyltransferase